MDRDGLGGHGGARSGCRARRHYPDHHKWAGAKPNRLTEDVTSPKIAFPYAIAENDRRSVVLDHKQPASRRGQPKRFEIVTRDHFARNAFEFTCAGECHL
jgi:hypothetical protein